MHNDKTREQVKQFAQKAAGKHGWEVQPDQDFLNAVLDGLLSNLQRLGYYQCPCRYSWDDRVKDRDIICPCSYAAEDIAEYGHCFCALFLSPEFIASGKEPGSIPERRPEELYPE